MSDKECIQAMNRHIKYLLSQLPSNKKPIEIMSYEKSKMKQHHDTMKKEKRGLWEN